MADETAKASGGKGYLLDGESSYSSVEVDDQTVTKSESAKLTQDQYDRASAIDGVKLVEAGKE